MKLEDFKKYSLAEWLSYIEAIHPKSIEMGLGRVKQVQQRLALSPTFPIVTVAGTNGKGSTCAMLSRIYHEAGYRVASYSSPHLIHYNERVNVECEPVSDEQLCNAFFAIESARGDTELTYFEYGTLAAMWVFMHSQVDVAVLEVGLGGRLDAVNMFEPACSLVTSVDIDHIDYLGDSRESISFEKAGVFRAGKPAICGDLDVCQSLLQHAENIGADLKLVGRDFLWSKISSLNGWRFQQGKNDFNNLPLPALLGEFQLDNAACALSAVVAMKQQLPVTEMHIASGLKNVKLAGRFQTLADHGNVILDVAHNPHAATALLNNLTNKPSKGRTLAVFSMLADKDIQSVVEILSTAIDAWYVAEIGRSRGAQLTDLVKVVKGATENKEVKSYPDVISAYQQACFDADENDRILVFGSFLTVADVLSTVPSGNSDL